MDVAITAAGFLIVAVTVADLGWTTLAASGGGGPVTSRLAHYLWRLARVPRGFPRRHQVLRLVGLAVVGTTILVWFVMMWLGWAMVFAGGQDAVVSSTSGEPAGWWGVVYFAGTTIWTLGPGDLVAQGPGWRILTAVASMSGLLVATLAITYLVPVIGAVTHRRQVALQISALGEDPYEIAGRSTDAQGRSDLARHLQDLTGKLQRLAQQHLTYPALHYFHDVNRETAGPVQIAVLDEALTMLTTAPPAIASIETTVASARAAVRTFLGTLTAAYISPSEHPPPPPDPRRVRAAGLETSDDEDVARQIDDLSERRSALLGLVEDDGWNWGDVYPAHSDEDEGAPRGSVAEAPDGGADEDG